MTAWSAADLARIEAADELTIAVERPDGTARSPAPVWAVRVGDDVVVRTWFHRDTGWYGHALLTKRAVVRVPGVDARVAIERVGSADVALRAAVDGAYRAKYAGYGAATVDRMVGDEAAGTTLRLVPID